MYKRLRISLFIYLTLFLLASLIFYAYRIFYPECFSGCFGAVNKQEIVPFLVNTGIVGELFWQISTIINPGNITIVGGRSTLILPLIMPIILFFLPTFSLVWFLVFLVEKKIPLSIKIVRIFFLIVFVIFTIIFTIDLVRYKQFKLLNESGMRTLKIDESRLSLIDISNWHSYRNDKYGFELKYPVGWFYEEKSFIPPINTPLTFDDAPCELTIYLGDDADRLSYGALGRSFIDIYILDVSLNQYIEKQTKKNRWPSAEKIKTTTLDGQEAIKIEGISRLPGSLAPGHPSETLLFEHRGKTIYIIFGNDDKKHNSLDQIYFNMMHSFRFL